MQNVKLKIKLQGLLRKIEGLENKTLEEWIIIDKTSKKDIQRKYKL